MLLGLIVSIICAAAKTFNVVPLRWAINAYIEIIRNTPFLVQIFFIFFGLPSLGLRLTPNGAALLALVVNFGAYGTEIIRAGIEAIHKGQVEAGTALGLSKLQVFRYIIMKPALRTVYPALTSQFIYLMLTSSVVSADLGRRPRRSGQRPAVVDVRKLRNLYHRDPHLSRDVDRLLCNLLGDREGRVQIPA